MPTSRILGDSEVFIDVGSMLNLTCEVDNGFEEPAFILWFHGDKVLYYGTPNSINAPLHCAPATIFMPSLNREGVRLESKCHGESY